MTTTAPTIAKDDRLVLLDVNRNTYQTGTVIRVTKRQFRVQPDGTIDKDSQQTFKLDPYKYEEAPWRWEDTSSSRWVCRRAYQISDLAHVEAFIKQTNDRNAAKEAARRAKQEARDQAHVKEIEELKTRVNLARDTRMVDTVADVLTRVVDVLYNGDTYRITINVWKSEQLFREDQPFEAAYTYTRLNRPGSYCSTGTFRCASEDEGIWESIHGALRW